MEMLIAALRMLSRLLRLHRPAAWRTMVSSGLIKLPLSEGDQQQRSGDPTRIAERIQQ